MAKSKATPTSSHPVCVNFIGLFIWLMICLLNGAHAGDWQLEWKSGLSVEHYSKGSLEYLQYGDDLERADNSLRIKYQHTAGKWQFNWQHMVAYSAYSDVIEKDAFINGFSSSSDSYNQIGLRDSQFASSARSVGMHGLQRASFGYASRNWVIRLGRQAISWGNGSVFQTFDLFNPFSPTSIDTSYKPGADMVYAQYLRDNGGDIQILWLPRGNGSTENSAFFFQSMDGLIQSANQVDSIALKSLYYWKDWQTEFLLAKDFDNHVLGSSFSVPVGDSLVKWDTTNTRWSVPGIGGEPRLSNSDSNLAAIPEDRSIWQSVITWQYSWSMFGKPASGFVEYYFNQLSVDGNKPIDVSILTVDQLLALRRGQLFSLRRHNVALGLQWQLSEKHILSPSILFSPEDDSWLLMSSLQWDLNDHSNLLVGAQYAHGDPGSQYGGVWLNQLFRQGLSSTRRLWLRYEYYW